MKYLVLIPVLFALSLSAQINPANVTIARDSFGVPHIFAKTDAEVAYGLAWAHSEDDFKNIQYNILAGKNMLGRVLGKDGVLFDFGLQFLNISETVEKKYDTDISPEYKKVLEGYAQGLNAYAAAHPKEVLYKREFPVTPKDIIKGSVLETSLLAGVGMAIKSIRDGRIREFYQVNNTGSNGMAIDPLHTADGKTYLLINSHQPIEGRFAWYEAHLQSEEGWDIIGGLFPGGSTIYVGSNEHLGWAHTTNYHNFGDIYEIKVNPENKNQYLYDGEWHEFGKRIVKLKVKMAGIKIPVKKTVLLTEYGPTFKGKNDALYAIRFPAYEDIRATDQWYKMNKAKNFSEFEAAVKMHAIPLFNIIYGDADGNIFFHSGGIVPERNPKLDWSQPIAGISSEYKWSKCVPYEGMPTVLNPTCGFVYNCNNTPLNAAGAGCEWQGNFVGVHRFTFNRGERFKYLLESHQGKFTWDDFRNIKFDKVYQNDTSASYLRHFRQLYSLDASKYPDIADAIAKFKRWNLSADVENKDAALAMVTHEYLIGKYKVPFAFFMISKNNLSEEDAVEAVRYAKKFLLKTHHSLDIPLGDVQRLIRGNVSIPASGMQEVARDADGKLYDKKKGIYHVTKGDGYMQMVKFSKGAMPEVYSVTAFGASAHPGSPHYTDQMEMFEKEQFKKMTFDKTEILKKAIKVYHPVQGK